MLTSLAKEKIKIAAGLPNRRSHRPIHHSLAPSTAGTRTPCGQTTAWPGSAAGPSYPLAAMPFYCSWRLPTIGTATQNISSPAGGEKHQKHRGRGEKHSSSVLWRLKNIGCGTYIIWLLFGLEREVLRVCDEGSRELLHLKDLGPLLLVPAENFWFGRGEEGVRRRSHGSRRSVGAERGLKATAGGIPLVVLSLNILD